jgi:hypothetical protein
MTARIGRRRLLVASGAAGAAALAGAGVLGGCKRSETCPPSPLSAEDKKLRDTLHYSDHSPDPDKLCNACQQYVANADADCGGCKLLKGPIHPAGYCSAFSARG